MCKIVHLYLTEHGICSLSGYKTEVITVKSSKDTVDGWVNIIKCEVNLIIQLILYFISESKLKL